jgi:hypothetical protein
MSGAISHFSMRLNGVHSDNFPLSLSPKHCGCYNLFCNVWVSAFGGCFDNCVGVLVICILVFTVFCIVCTVFLSCFVYVYLFLFVLSVLV